MCGIVGVLRRTAPPDRALLVAMRDAMAHRGPDDAGTWWEDDGTVGLAHRRLAIIDLSALGHQPMSDVAGELVIVLNGEIYNYRAVRQELEARGHRFRSQSDTEVILEAFRAWGDDFLERLNGMFAFALWDRRARRLVLARDRAGEKPLFIRRTTDGLGFASELKALMTDPAMPRVADRQGVESFLAYGYVPGDRCILQGVEKLPPAHAMAYDLETGACRRWRYWDLPPQRPDQPVDGEALTDELEALLADSVRQRLMASDVPVGILLSGGLDSSLVTAAAARVTSEPVRTFTIAFPGAGRLDESSHARLVATHFGTRHTELQADAATADLLPLLAAQFDEPSADSSMVPTYLVSRLIREHATVALGGDGGDELFGGYHWHSYVLQQARARRFLPAPLAAAGRGAVGLMPRGIMGRNYLTGFFDDTAGGIARFNMIFDAAHRRDLLAPLGPAVDDAPLQYKRSLVPETGTVVRRVTESDFRSYLVDDVLVKVDRASMLTSLEVRAPFLDQHLIEFAFGRVPDALKTTRAARKIMLRRLGARWLPPALDLTRKQGFAAPVAQWFQGAWGSFMQGVLDGMDPAVFDRAAVRRLVAEQQRGLRHGARLFALTMFELWRRTYGITVAAE